MIDSASGEQLAQAAKSEAGRQLLSEAKQAFTGNIEYQKLWGEFFTSKEKVAADEQRTQEINVAVRNAAKAELTSETQSIQNAAVNNSTYCPVTEEQVRAIMLPKVADRKNADFEKSLPDYTRRLNETIQRFGVNTPAKRAAFLATVARESTGMTAITELPMLQSILASSFSQPIYPSFF